MHHRTRIVTSGVAARLAPADTAAVLAAVAVDDAVGLPGTGAIAVGALPFDPGADGELVIPARVFGALDGRAWLTEIGPSRRDVDADVVPPTRFTVAAPRSRDEWRAAVERALDAIGRGDLEKVVLAREVLIEADTPFDAREIVRGLVASQPGSFVYASEGFVGASPELLVRRTGAVVESRPVAGTTIADSDEALLALAASVKDTQEHRFVVDGIVDALEPRCGDLTVATTPEVAVFGPVAHLATPIRGALHEPAPSALDVARSCTRLPQWVGHRATPRSTPSVRSRVSTAGATRGRSGGSTRTVTASGPSPCAGPSSTAPGRASSPAPASSPVRNPTPNGPRPRPSSNRCCGPSCGPSRDLPPHSPVQCRVDDA